MRYVELDGQRVSVIGLGTWQFGSREWRYGETYARDTAPALVRRALELGVNLIDTAEAYGFGRSEQIVGQATEGGPDGLLVATKLLPILPLPALVDWQAAGSRRRLRVDALDLYQLHFPNPFVSVRTAIRPLRGLVDDGLVRRVGVSNYSLKRWRAAERALGRAIPTNQILFSLASPLPQFELVPYARAEGRLLIAYSPLGQGFLSADGPERAVPLDIRRRNPLARPAQRRRAAPLFAALREVARAHDATPAQVALAWLIGHGNVIAIPGARTVEQLEENVAAADLDLDPADHARLSSAALAAL